MEIELAAAAARRISLETNEIHKVEHNILRYAPWVRDNTIHNFKYEKGNLFLMYWFFLTGTFIKKQLNPTLDHLYGTMVEFNSACFQLAFEVMVETEYDGLFVDCNHALQWGFKIRNT